MSTSVEGRITSSFIRSTSVVPPASGWIAATVRGSLAGAAAASACTADDGSVALRYAKGRMGLAFLLVGQDRRRRLFHRRDDVRIGGAAADVAAHIFADIVVAVGMPLGHAGHRRHYLSRRAVTAL